MSYRFGYRGADHNPVLQPNAWDRALEDVDHWTHGNRSYVILRHAETGNLYARHLHANVPSLVRVFRTGI